MSDYLHAPLPFNQLDALEPLIICKLENWALSSLTGDDRASYLNGQLSIDITKLSAGDSSLAAHCDAKGKMLAVLRVFVFDNEIVLAQKQSTAELQLAALKKFAVFSKVDITTNGDWSLYGIAGSQANEWYQQRLKKPQANEEIVLTLTSPQKRYLLLSKKPLESNTHEDVWQALDIAAVMPQLELATQLQFIPQMLNLQHLDAISFTKGCYIGQETIARAKYRGTNKRATFLVKGTSTQVPAPGDIIEQQLESGNWRMAGTVLQSVQYQDQHIELLAVLPKDLDLQSLLRLKDDASSELLLALQAYPLERE